MIAKMRNMGEACTAANRFYVHEAVHDEFARKLSDKMAALPVARDFYDMGFKLLATRGTALFLEDNSIPARAGREAFINLSRVISTKG